MAAVASLADAVGGVPVCLRSATADRSSGAGFPAGEQVLNGDAALAFVRQRHHLPNGDLDRIVRLQAVLRSLVVKLRDADLTAVVKAVEGRVMADPNLDLLGFATDLVRAKSLHVGTIPVANPDFQAPGGGSVVAVDPAAVRQYVTDLQGTPPATCPASTSPCVGTRARSAGRTSP